MAGETTNTETGIAKIYLDMANAHDGSHETLGAKAVAAQRAAQGKNIGEVLAEVAQDNVGDPKLGEYIVAAKEGFDYYNGVTK